MNNRFDTHLHLLQLEGYSPNRFLRWWVKNPFVDKSSQKVPLNWTWKAKTLKNLSVLILGLLIAITIASGKYLAIIIPLSIWLIAPFVYLFGALLILKPYEIFNKWRTIQQTRTSILNHKDLVVIGVTGSFGKTTTKDFLFDMLREYKNTLKTPQSYNTIFGIAKVIDLELLSKTRFFICEMGAYIRGEIKTLTHEVPPQYAILTAIGTQHLERFKTLKNTTLAKFELVDAVDPKKALVNLDNEYIAEHIKLPRYKGVKTYGIKNPNADFNVTDYGFTDQGLEFTLKHDAKKYNFIAKLFGTSSLQNLTAAISMAFMLGVPFETIRDAASKLKPSAHRLELKNFGKAILIDDAYSSNEQGFNMVMDDLKLVKGKKVLITPGIVELGDKTQKVHQQIGQKAADIFDRIVLVGESERTSALESAIQSQNSSVKVEYLDRAGLWPTINKLAEDYQWILLENDLPDNY